MWLNIFKFCGVLFGGTLFVTLLVRQYQIRRRIYTKFLHDLLKSSKSVKNPSYATRLFLAGKTFIVTGASSGIGEATTLELARLGARVIMACRDIPKAEAVRDRITQQILEENDDECNRVSQDDRASFNVEKKVVEYSNLPTYPNLVVKKLDLSDLVSVRAFAQDVNAHETRCDVLINNGGIMRPTQSFSPQGYEMTWATNHLGHFYLTLLLLPLLTKTAKSKLNKTKSIINAETSNLVDDQSSKETLTKKRITSTQETSSNIRDENVDNHNVNSYLIPTGNIPWSTNLDKCIENVRVVIVSSALHKAAPANLEEFALLNTPETPAYSVWRAYQYSKLCNIAFANELARRLATGHGLEPFLASSDIPSKEAEQCDGIIPITVNSLHPGVVVTYMSRDLDPKKFLLKGLYVKYGHLFFKTPFQGCQTTIYCALAPELNEVTGRYFGMCQEHIPAPQTQDELFATQLWNFSLDCVRAFEDNESTR